MRVKRSVFTFLMLVSMAVMGFAQSSAPDGWYYGKPIQSVTFDGLVNTKESDLEGVTASFIGKRFSDEVYEDLLNRTFALDLFEDLLDIRVNPVGGDYRTCTSINVVLVVKEFPVIAKLRFVGYHQVRLTELKDAVTSSEKSIYNENTRLSDERALRDLYIGKGYTEIKVSSSAEQGEDGYTVTFVLDEGQKTVVSKILFNGNTTVSSGTLRGKISLKEVGLFQKGSFQEAMLEQDVKAITAYYKDRGYVDAKVVNYTVDAEFNEEKNRRELTIQFNIQEGSRYTFAGVAFVGNNVFSEEELQLLVRQKPGDVYNETRYQETLMAVQNRYYESGYTSNGFQAQVQKNADEKTIGYTIYIQENERSHIENIIIRGNNKTKDEVIRREIPMETGDIFSYSKLMNGMRNLYNLQYFTTQIYPDITPGSEENLVDIVFNLEEQSTTSLDFGFTFSGVANTGDFPVALFAKIQDSNFMGTGQSISAGLQLSTTEQSVSLGYGQNWLFGLPISNSISLSYAHSTKNTPRNHVNVDGSVTPSGYYMEYQQHEFNISASLGRRWTPNFAILTATGGLSGSLINNVYDNSLYIPYDSNISNFNNNWEPRNSLYASFSADGRNISYDATAGWFASQRFTWYGLLPKGVFGPDWGESEFYLRSDTKAEKYFTLLDKPFSETWSLKLVLMAYSGLSLQFPVGDSNIKQSNQLYIDGMFNGRGWNITSDSGGFGRALWNNTVELRMPIVPGILAADFFFDASMIKSSPSQIFTDFANGNDWYFSYGPSIRFCIQQFPLRLLFVNNFQVKNGQGIVWEDERGNPTSWLKSWHWVLSFNVANH